MISLSEIKELISSGESELLEFKKSTAEKEKACQTICAFANGRGGQLVFGVTPQGKIIGQDIGKQTLEQLTQSFKNFDPPMFPQVDRLKTKDDNELIIVKISRSNRIPCSYKGVAYKRVGNTTSVMLQDEYKRLMMEYMHGHERWDNTTAADWAFDMLDEKEIILTLEEAIRRGRLEDPQTRDIKEVLRGFGLLSRQGKILRAAIVLFAKEPYILPDFPQLKLRIAKFRGNDKTEFLDNRQLLGNAFHLIRQAEKFLVENLPIAGKIVPGIIERIDDPLYPREALREALANAFCHRDYSLGGGSVAVAIYDHQLEITSSGDLHFGLSAEDLLKPHESLPWNPLIARIFYLRGIIDSWGRGTLKIAELTKAAGLVCPKINATSGAVSVCFNPNRYIASRHIGHDINERQHKILQILGESKTPSLQLNQIVKKLRNLSGDERQIRNDLQFLAQLGLIKVKGRGRGAKWFLLHPQKK